MFKIFIAGPDLPLVDRPDTFRKSFQGMSAVENAPCAFAKGVDHALGLAAMQEHNGGYTLRGP